MSAAAQLYRLTSRAQAAQRRVGDIPLGQFLEVEIGRQLAAHERHRAYAEFVALAHDANREAVEYYNLDSQAPDQAQQHPAVRAIRELEAILTQNSATSHLRIFKDLNLHALEVLAATLELQEVGRWTTPSEESIESYRTQLLDLADRTDRLHLDPRLKRALRDAITGMLHALADFEVWGAAGVDRAVGSLMIAIIRAAPEADDEGRAWLKESAGVGASLVTIFDTGARYVRKLPAVLEAVKQLMGG